MLYIILYAIYAHLYISFFHVMQIKLSHHPVHILSLILSCHNDSYFALHSLQFSRAFATFKQSFKQY